MKRALILSSLLVALTATAFAQSFTDGNGRWLDGQWQAYQRYHKHTEKSSAERLKDLAEGGFYEGFILGSMDAGLDVVKVPAGVSISQMARAVGRYLDGHHNVWKRPAGLLVLEILRHSFPPTGGRNEFGLSGRLLDRYWHASRKVKKHFREKSPSITGTEFVDAVLYSGYLTAVNTTSTALLQGASTQHLTSEQIETAVGNYLDKHRKQWDQPGAELVVRALLSAYPKKG